MFRIIRWVKSLFKRPKYEEIEPPIQIPPPSGKPGFTLGAVKGATKTELDLAHEAVHMMNKVLVSDVFRSAVLAAKFTSTRGVSNDKIYEMYTKSEHMVNIEFFTGTWRQNNVWRTVAYDNADEFVHVNRVFVTEWVTLASTCFHEIAHALGFSHKSASEHTSVPYTMNEIFEECVEKLGLK